MSWVEKIRNFYVDPTEDQVVEIRALDHQSKRLWCAPIKNVIAQRFAMCGWGVTASFPGNQSFTVQLQSLLEIHCWVRQGILLDCKPRWYRR